MNNRVNGDFVLGFLFSPDGGQVVLVQKPKSAKNTGESGLWNGISGTIESSENAKTAIERRGVEVVGQWIDKWQLFTEIRGTGWTGSCYKVFSPDFINARQMGESEVKLWDIRTLCLGDGKEISVNVQWLVAIALDRRITGVQQIWYGG